MSKSNPTFEVEVSSITSIFPSSPQGDEITTPLSIIDSTVAKFGRCAAIWYFDVLTNPSLVTSSHLQASLSKTLNSYQHFSGRLSWSHASRNFTDHTSRYRRAHITYNTPADIGIPFTTATSPHRLSDFLPDGPKGKAWDSTQVPSSELVPSTPLALSQDNLLENTPNMVIQHTTFACGSAALSISITHSLSDAQTLSNFANDWSSISRAMLSNSPLPTLSPIFNPGLLDQKAAGDINAPSPDISIQQKARNLPMHRYDWYAQVPTQPWGNRTPLDFPSTATTTLSPGIPIPWHQWDTTLPVSSRVLHFTPEEIQTLYNTTSRNGEITITKHDALIAHLWSRINHARQQPLASDSHLNFSLGLRQRLGLPLQFVGSSITLAAISSPCSTPASILAEKINNTMKMFTAENIGCLLHDEAFEVGPQRIWRGCLGTEHVMVTSWIYSGIGEVDFGNGRARWVEPVMGRFDGLCAVLEGVAGAETGDVEGKGHWAREGVDVWVYLEKGAMERLVEDEGLHF